MATVILILFSVFALIFLIGMIGDKDAENRRSFAFAFCTLVLAIVLILYKFL